jgi:ketosteroid isomerase-like protein
MDWPYTAPGMTQAFEGRQEILEAMSMVPTMFNRFSMVATQHLPSPATNTLVTLAKSTGEFKDGVPYANEYVLVLTFNGDRIERWSEYLNPLKVRNS